MVASLAADGVRLTRVEPHEPTLEDLYFTIRRQAGVAGSGTARRTDDGGTEIVAGRRDRPGQPLAPIATGHGDLPPLGTGPTAARTERTDEGVAP